MSVRKAEAKWKGTLKEGSGQIDVESKAISVPYDWRSRFDVGERTNPEELIGAAHAGCYSMFVSALLTGAGFTPEELHTTATVHLERDDRGPVIPKIELALRAKVPGVDAAQLQEIADKAKANCPISRALAAVGEITLTVQLVS